MKKVLIVSALLSMILFMVVFIVGAQGAVSEPYARWFKCYAPLATVPGIYVSASLLKRRFSDLGSFAKLSCTSLLLAALMMFTYGFGLFHGQEWEMLIILIAGGIVFAVIFFMMDLIDMVA